MNFAIPFVKHFPYDSAVTEYIIEYDFNKDTTTELMDFLSLYAQKRVVISIKKDVFDIKQATVITKAFPNAVYQINSFVALMYKDELTEHKIPFIVDIICYNLDILNSILKMGVSQVIIGFELGFSLPHLYDRIKKDHPNVLIKVIINTYQHLDPAGTLSFIKGFFIRPEDTKSYAEFVDIFEIKPQENKESLKVLWEAYAENQKWYGDLRPLITSLPQELDNRRIIPNFGPARIGCGKRCYLNSGCNICGRILELGEAFKDKDIFLIPRKEGTENGD